MLSSPTAPSVGESETQLPEDRLLLTHLPIEILSNLVGLLEPTGIVTLGRCCRLLYDVSNSRQVWLGALKTTIMENKIFLSTYPISTMTARDLKEACTRPWRLQHRIWRTRQRKLRPELVRTLLLYPTGLFSIREPRYQQLELVPGGRFLLTLDTVQRLCLWDLGHRTDSVFSQAPLAELSFQRSQIELYIVPQPFFVLLPTTDGDGILFCMEFLHPITGDTEVKIIEIHPSSEAPQFETLGTRQFTNNEVKACFTLTSHYYAYCTDEQLVIWDFRRDLQSRMNCSRFTRDILISGDSVILFHIGGYSVFAIPLPTADDTLYVVETTAAGQFVINSQHILEYVLPRPWYTASLYHSSQQSVDIDFVGASSEDNGYRIYHYVYKPDGSSVWQSSIKMVDDTFTDRGREFAGFAMIDDQRARVLLNRKFINIRVSRGNGVSEEGNTVLRELHERRHGELTDEQGLYWTFCPFSGRLCTVSLGGEIRIMDFVR